MTRFKPVPVTVLLLFLTVVSGCDKLLDAGSPGTTDEDVFSNDSLANGAIVALYSHFMWDNESLFNGGVSWLAAVSADELQADHWEADGEFYNSEVSPKNKLLHEGFWKKAYALIYHCNTLVEGLTGPNTINDTTRARIMGEARFLRALNYYYLTAAFGDVPLILATEYKKTAFLPRTPVAAVYDQILSDLKEAEGLLTDNRSNAFAGRLACQALLARVYLQREDWANAEKYSTAVIQSGRLQLETDLNRAFLRSSKEVIFQLEPVAYPYNAMEGYLFGVAAVDKAPAFFMTPGLVAAFETGDLRKLHWMKSYQVGGVTYHIPNKYKVHAARSASNEYNVVLRLAEQYLIRAEARAKLSRIPEAVNDLNVIRGRAGLGHLPHAMAIGSCLQAIEQERRMELFTEWGHRWFDLRRTGRATAVLGPLKGPYWEPTDQLYPIPEEEIRLNPNLTQNEGYY